MISRKIIFSVVSVIIFFGLIATSAVFYLTQTNLITNKKLALVTNTVSQSNEIKQILINSENLVTTIASQQKIINYFKDKKDVLDILNSYNISNQYSAIYLLDENGIALTSTDPTFINKDYSFRDYYQASIKGEKYIDVSIGSTSGLLGYYFSSPIKSDDNKILGVAVIKLIPEVINNVVEINSNNYNSLMLSDNYGVIVFSTDTNRVYKSLGKLSDEYLNEIKLGKRYANKEITALGYQVVQDEIGITSAPKSFDIVDTVDKDEKELVTLVKIDKYPFYLVGESMTNDIFFQALKTSLILAGLVLLAAILAAIVIAFFIKKFTEPLVILKKACENIKNNNLSEKIVVSSKDEFQDLAESINQMVDKINISNQDLEAKVNERTESLSRLNNLMVGRELKMMELKQQLKK